MRTADRLLARTVRQGGAWSAVLIPAQLGRAVLQLALPYILGRAVDDLISGAGARSGWLLAGGCVLAGVVACETLGIWAAQAAGTRASARLRLDLLRHVLGVGPGLARRFPEGDLVTRLGINTDEAGRAPEALVTTVAMVLPTVGALVALTLISPWLPLTLVAGLILVTFVLRAFLRDSTAIARDYQQTQGEIAARLSDALAGARTIAAAGTAGTETRRVLAPLPRLREHGMRLWRTNARAGVQTGLAVPLLEVAVIGVGGLLMANGDLTVGELYAAARYTVLGAAIGETVGQLGRLARARGAAGRLAELLAAPPVRYGDRPLPGGPGTVEFRGVSLSLSGGGLDQLDLTIPGGRAVAVVGRSGTGKSLLAALAGRLIDPDRGTVLLDGVPLPEIGRPQLRRAIGYAFERPVLLGDTLAEAIALGTTGGASGSGEDQEDLVTANSGGTPTALATTNGEGAPGAGEPAARVVAAARAAGADGFIQRLPEGYGTPLADAPMSGGERQRIGLARAFAQGERLLVLDDATSSLDTVTERQVGEALTGELRDRTRLIVAHRVATAARADQVVWLDGGRVRAVGTHRELWADPGYRAVFQA